MHIRIRDWPKLHIAMLHVIVYVTLCINIAKHIDIDVKLQCLVYVDLKL